MKGKVQVNTQESFLLCLEFFFAAKPHVFYIFPVNEFVLFHFFLFFICVGIVRVNVIVTICFCEKCP
jgi:hypothetical protein